MCMQHAQAMTRMSVYEAALQTQEKSWKKPVKFHSALFPL